MLASNVLTNYLEACMGYTSETRVLKNSSSLLLLISSFQRSLTLLALFVTFLKISCLHVSFTAYENFYKLSKNVVSSCLLSTFCPSEVSEIRNSTIKHISIYSLVHSSICTYGRSLSGDLLSIIMLCPTKSQSD